MFVKKFVKKKELTEAEKNEEIRKKMYARMVRINADKNGAAPAQELTKREHFIFELYAKFLIGNFSDTPCADAIQYADEFLVKLEQNKFKID